MIVERPSGCRQYPQHPRLRLRRHLRDTGDRMEADCPCGSGATYVACCAPLHTGTATATTAEQLMRSRYSAFAVRDQGYLLATWHPATRPAAVELDLAVEWRRLCPLGAGASGGTMPRRPSGRRGPPRSRCCQRSCKRSSLSTKPREAATRRARAASPGARLSSSPRSRFRQRCLRPGPVQLLHTRRSRRTRPRTDCRQPHSAGPSMPSRSNSR
jgi:hypothetical protein